MDCSTTIIMIKHKVEKELSSLNKPVLTNTKYNYNLAIVVKWTSTLKLERTSQFKIQRQIIITKLLLD